jgi:hypothetical protein
MVLEQRAATLVSSARAAQAHSRTLGQRYSDHPWEAQAGLARSMVLTVQADRSGHGWFVSMGRLPPAVVAAHRAGGRVPCVFRHAVSFLVVLGPADPFVGPTCLSLRHESYVNDDGGRCEKFSIAP